CGGGSRPRASPALGESGRGRGRGGPREGNIAAVSTKNRPTAIFFNGLLKRHTALFFNGRDDVRNVGGNQITVFFNGLLNRQTVILFNGRDEVRRDIGSNRIVVSWKLGHAVPPSTACIDHALRC